MLDCDSLKKHQKKHKKLSEQYTDAEKLYKQTLETYNDGYFYESRREYWQRA